MNKTTPASILIVDDEEMIRETLIDVLEDEDYQVTGAENAQAARALYDKLHPDLILLDIWMPDVDGITLLREWQAEGTLRCPVIMMSGHGTIETAVEATKLGAYDFLEKPLSTAKLLLTVERALQNQALVEQNAELKAKIDPPVEIIGRSPVMQTLRDHVNLIATQKVPIFITGDAGTGKQHIAHYIHQHSNYSDGAFVVLSAATMDAENIQPTLVGDSKRHGLLAQAEGGTLFIDEVNELPREVQHLFSTIIEYGHYVSEYGGKQKEIACHLIFASRYPQSLLKETLESALFDHLSVATIKLPRLNEHSADVPELLDYFSQYFADVEQMPYRHFSLAAQNTLRQHSWSGNVRELRNLVQRLLIQGDTPEISAEEAEAALTPAETEVQDGIWSQIIPQDLSLREAREMFEHQYLLEQFRHCDGNVAQLASRVGMDRTNLYRKLRSLGIDPTHKPN